MENNTRKVIKIIKFFNDGTYEEVVPEEIVQVNNQEMDVELNLIFNSQTTSRRIQYNVAVCVLCKQFYNEGCSDYIKKSFNYLKDFTHVTYQTVTDKTFRQLELSSATYSNCIINYVEHNNEEIKIKLLEKIGTHTADADRRLIEQYL